MDGSFDGHNRIVCTSCLYVSFSLLSHPFGSPAPLALLVRLEPATGATNSPFSSRVTRLECAFLRQSHSQRDRRDGAPSREADGSGSGSDIDVDEAAAATADPEVCHPDWGRHSLPHEWGTPACVSSLYTSVQSLVLPSLTGVRWSSGCHLPGRPWPRRPTPSHFPRLRTCCCSTQSAARLQHNSRPFVRWSQPSLT